MSQSRQNGPVSHGLMQRLIEYERSPFHQGPSGVNVKFRRELLRTESADAGEVATVADQIRLVALHVENFGPFRDVSVQFEATDDRPICLVEAINGRGKSTVVRALLFALNADVPAGMNYPARLLHKGVTSPEADISVEVVLRSSADGRIAIRRRVRFQGSVHNYRKRSESFDIIFERDVDIHGREAEEWLAERFPREVLGYFIFDAEHSPVSALSGQLGEQLPEVRGQVEAVLGVGVVRRASQRCQRIAQEWRRELDRNDSAGCLAETSARLVRAQQDLAVSQEALSEATTVLQDSSTALDEARARWQGLRSSVDSPKAEERSEIDRRLGKLNERIEMQRHDLQSVLQVDLPLSLMSGAIDAAHGAKAPRDLPAGYWSTIGTT